MLYPQSNRCARPWTFPAFWDFCIDPSSDGEAAGWSRGSPSSRPIAVSASWNDQYLDLHDYLGLAWYQTSFDLPWAGGTQDGFAFACWPLQSGSTGSLPGATRAATCRSNLTSRRSCGRNRTGWSGTASPPDRALPGNVPPDPNDVFSNQNYPAASFDFFYCGIHRPVWITARHPDGIDDLEGHDRHDGADGQVAVELLWAGAAAGVAAPPGQWSRHPGKRRSLYH
ncbi:MAG: hypothetical protein U0X20_23990 [Caldilineaceae bacterium]